MNQHDKIIANASLVIQYLEKKGGQDPSLLNFLSSNVANADMLLNALKHDFEMARDYGSTFKEMRALNLVQSFGQGREAMQQWQQQVTETFGSDKIRIGMDKEGITAVSFFGEKKRILQRTEDVWQTMVPNENPFLVSVDDDDLVFAQVSPRSLEELNTLNLFESHDLVGMSPYIFYGYMVSGDVTKLIPIEVDSTTVKDREGKLIGKYESLIFQIKGTNNYIGVTSAPAEGEMLLGTYRKTRRMKAMIEDKKQVAQQSENLPTQADLEDFMKKLQGNMSPGQNLMLAVRFDLALLLKKLGVDKKRQLFVSLSQEVENGKNLYSAIKAVFGDDFATRRGNK